MKLIDIGHGNFISDAHFIALISPDSAPSKRLVQNARDQMILIDASHGKKTRSIIIMDSGHVILSSLEVEKVQLSFRDTEEND